MGILRYTKEPQATEVFNMAQLPYPYTTGAKLMAFPFKFHFQNPWIVKAWCIGLVMTAPIMYKIQMASGYGMFGEGAKNQERLSKLRIVFLKLSIAEIIYQNPSTSNQGICFILHI